MAVAGALGQRASPMRHRRPQAGRGRGLRRDRPAGGGVVRTSRGSCDQLAAGTQRAAARPLQAAQRSSTSRSTSCRRRRGAPVHTSGCVPVYPATEGSRRARSASSSGSDRAHPRRGRAAAGRRCALAERLPDRPGRARRRPTSRTSEDDEAGRAPAARLRGAVPARAVAGGAQAGARRGRAGAPPVRGDGRAGRPVAGDAAVRARPATSEARRARSTPTSRASGRCSGC